MEDQFIRNIQIHRTDKQFVRLYYIEFCFSADFRALSLNKNCLFNFTPARAQIIEILVDHLESGIKMVPHSVILGRLLGDDIGEHTILKSYFKSANDVHPAWGTLIKSTGGRDASVYLDFECLIPPSSAPSLATHSIVKIIECQIKSKNSK